MRSSRLSLYVLALSTACLDTASTELYPQLQPMLFQVRGNAAVTGSNGDVSQSRVFSFGTNPDAGPTDTPDPATLTMAATMQNFRLVMSDLLVGNYLENISCRDGTFQFVPVGATPDDIAKCAVSQDELPLLCTGEYAVCLCQTPGGCDAIQLDGPPILVPQGQPVGVLDQNGDGAADAQQFRQGAVGIVCTGVSGLVHDVGIDLDASYYSPSGDQQAPTDGLPTPFDALGPAIVLVPNDFGVAPSSVSEVLPTSSACNFAFAPQVVDKKGERPCAPIGGFGGSGVVADQLSCVPGNTSAADFTTEPLVFQVTDDALAGGVVLTGSGQTLGSNTDVLTVQASDNIPINPVSIDNITMLQGSAAYTQFAATLVAPSAVQIMSTAANGFVPGAAYTLSIPATVTDSFGEPNRQPIELTFASP